MIFYLKVFILLACQNPRLRLVTSPVGNDKVFTKLVEDGDDLGASKLKIEDLLKKLICSEKTLDCHLNDCVDCTELKNLLEKNLNRIFDENQIETLEFEQWDKTDYSTTTTKQVSKND